MIRRLEKRSDKITWIRRRNKFKIGEILIAVKEHPLVPHGRFLKWIESEFQWTDRTAENYMNLARSFKFETVANLPITITAMYDLGVDTVPQELRDKAVTRAAEGSRIDREWAHSEIQYHRSLSDTGPFKTPWDRRIERDQLRLAKNLPLKRIDPVNIVHRVGALRRGVEDLYRQCKMEFWVYLRSKETDREFRRNTRIAVTDVFFAEYFDDDDNWALLGEMYQRACELRRHQSCHKTRTFVKADPGGVMHLGKDAPPE
jgi:hypothetical protein